MAHARDLHRIIDDTVKVERNDGVNDYVAVKVNVRVDVEVVVGAWGSAHFAASVVSPLMSRYGSSFLNVL